MTAVRIAAGINTYANPNGLKPCLDSLCDGVDKRFVIHGAYPHFSYEVFHSLSDTRAICKGYLNTQLIHLETSELEKRQKYLDLASDCDFLLIIDDDEYLADGTDWGLVRDFCQKVIDKQEGYYIYDVMLGVWPEDMGPRPRLFYQPSKIKYERKHYWWRLPNGRLMDGCSDSLQVVPGIRIIHDKTLRMDGKYNLACLKYQHWLLEHESQHVRTAADL